MMRNLRLGEYPRADTPMRPRRAVDEKGMTDIHIPGTARGIRPWALERRPWQVTEHVAKEHPTLAKARQHARDVEVRAHQDLRRGVLRADIREQEQCQKAPAATVHIHPPLAMDVVAAVDVPPGVPGILQAGEADRNGAPDALAPYPPAWSEERVVHLPKRLRRPRGGKRWPFRARQAHNRRGPHCRVMRIDPARVQLLLDDLDTRAHNVWRYGMAYHQKSVCGEIAYGYCHFFLLWGNPTPSVRQWTRLTSRRRGCAGRWPAGPSSCQHTPCTPGLPTRCGSGSSGAASRTQAQRGQSRHSGTWLPRGNQCAARLDTRAASSRARRDRRGSRRTSRSSSPAHR